MRFLNFTLFLEYRKVQDFVSRAEFLPFLIVQLFNHQVIFCITHQCSQYIIFIIPLVLPHPPPFWLPIMFFQVTSSGNMRVKSYTVAMVTPAWCLVGKHFITSFIVTLFFLVGGGCRIRAGAFGGKPKVSICEKLTAACWQEHVKMMMVSRWLSWSAVVTEDGKPWSPSPSLTG